MSFQISIQPSRQAAARFVDRVRSTLLKAVMESGISQSEIARKLGVHRSVIHRELKGYQNLTLGRAAELAWAIGKNATFILEEQSADRSNTPKVEFFTIMDTSNKEVILSEQRQLKKVA